MENEKAEPCRPFLIKLLKWILKSKVLLMFKKATQCRLLKPLVSFMDNVTKFMKCKLHFNDVKELAHRPLIFSVFFKALPLKPDIWENSNVPHRQRK